MCLIMRLNRQSEPLTRAESDDIYRRNSDGIGIVSPSGRVIARTLVRDADHAWSLVSGVRDGWIHWRLATHGTVSSDNVHPFDVGHGCALLHNGILRGGWGDALRSDTAHYASALRDVVTRHGVKRTLADAGYRRALVQPGSVLVVVGPHLDGGQIISDRDGVQHKGRWYSNAYAWSPYAGIVDVVDDAVGLIASGEDVEELAWELSHVVDDPWLAQALGTPDPETVDLLLDLACDALKAVRRGLQVWSE